MVHSPIAVANSFIDVARSHGKLITHMKLQKLVYYAHGWSLGLLGTPLINGRVEAWKYGPVIDSIYHQFKKFGGEPITECATEFSFSHYGYIEPRIINDDMAINLINKIWDEYGSLSAIELSSMTHCQGGPWDRAINSGMNTITDDSMTEYFKSLSN